MILRVPTLGTQPPAHCYFFNILTELVMLHSFPRETHLGRHTGFLPPFPRAQCSANSSFLYIYQRNRRTIWEIPKLPLSEVLIAHN